MSSRRRVIFPFILILIAFAVITARLFLLQVWFHEDLNKRAEKIYCKVLPELPCRGMILDRNGKTLAMSVKTYQLFLDFKSIKDIADVKSVLRTNGITLTEKQIRDNANSSYLVIADNVGIETAKSIRGCSLAGVGFTPKYVRTYPEGKMASHILGVVGKEGSGLEGIEYTANSYLAGGSVRGIGFRDGRGRSVSAKLSNPNDSRGSNVYLTIDRNIQFIAEQEIEQAWKKSRSKKAIAIVQDPETGEILAMAIRPNYDPANFAGSDLRNPAVSDVFEPGSTFKAITSAAALEQNLVKRKELIWCENGAYKVYNHTIKDHEKKGLITFDQIMECSSNVGLAKVGQRLGKENLYNYAKQFGFYSPTGIDLPGEAKGLLKDPAKWSGLSLPVISFGQEVGVTAIQMINAYSAMANGGELLEPRIVEQVRNSSGNTLYQAEKRIIRKAVSPKIAAELRDILRGVVDRGTGQLAGVQGYTIGGKTGTAQKRDKRTGKYSTSCYVASFCGIAPVNNPKLTIFVVLDEPQGDYYAASQAAPIFRKIASRTLQYLRIQPDNEPMKLAGKLK